MNNDSSLIHRLKEARQITGVSLRAIASRTGIPVRILRQQEESNEISLTDLLKWKRALGVPFMELFNDSPDQLDEMIRLRAGLIQLMRGVRSLQHSGLSEQQEAMVENMAAELESLMPELNSINSWPQTGSRRRKNEPAKVESQMIATSLWCPEIGNEV